MSKLSKYFRTLIFHPKISSKCTQFGIHRTQTSFHYVFISKMSQTKSSMYLNRCEKAHRCTYWMLPMSPALNSYSKQMMYSWVPSARCFSYFHCSLLYVEKCEMKQLSTCQFQNSSYNMVNSRSLLYKWALFNRRPFDMTNRCIFIWNMFWRIMQLSWWLTTIPC